MLVLAAPLLAVLLLASSCGDDDEAADETTTTEESATTSSTATTSSSTTSTSATTSQTSGTTTTESTLPGEPFDGFPQDGDMLGVMGVAHDDVLNVRAVPGAGTEIVATAGPTADDVEATGEARLLPTTIWYQVRVGGVTGWVNSSFVGFVDGTDDATAEFLGGSAPPETETMVELGELVADGFASTDPPSTIVQSVAPTVGDLGEITYDVIGLGDDAVAGYRLHVFGTPSESGEGFVLKTIERTTFCSRGSTGELCA